MTSSEFRIRGAHLDADTAAVKKTKLSRKRRRTRGRERKKGERNRVVARGGGRMKMKETRDKTAR